MIKQNVQAVDEQPLEENLNRALADTTFARGIDEAISVLKYVLVTWIIENIVD